MYTIYSDNQLLYSPDMAYSDYALLSPKVETEVNMSGSVSFIMPPTNPAYDAIRKLSSIITVYDDGEEIFRGRVLHDEKDFYKRKNVYCEGELSFLLDSIVRPYEWSGSVRGLLEKYITDHNAQVEPVKQFKVGNVTVTDANDYIVRASGQYPDTLSEMNDKLLNLMGGYFFVRKEADGRYIDYLKDPPRRNAQTIEFGSNLLDITEYISADEVFTVLIPLGAEQEDGNGNQTGRLTIKSVNGNKDYIVDQNAVNLFGYVWRKQEWDDVTVASNLLTKGREFLKSGIEMAVSLTLKAIDLHLLDVNTERLKVGDIVRVISVPHKVDQYFLCSKITLDITNPGNSEYTFGYTFTTMTEKMMHSSNTIQTMAESVSDVVSTANNAASQAQSAADQAQQAAQVVVNMPTEYVKTETFNQFRTEINEKVASVYHVKGSVETYAALPTTHEVGDVYNISDTGANYVWTSYGWDKLSETVDLSGLATIEQLQAVRDMIPTDANLENYTQVTEFNALLERVGRIEGLVGTGGVDDE